MTLVEFINFKLAFLTILAQVFIALSLAYLLFFRKQYSFIEKFLAKNGMLLAFLVALFATLDSLFYSEIAHYAPCELCWYQRIFMYPQVFLLGLALFKKDKGVIKYSMMLAVIGVLISAYQYLMQLGFVDGLCAAGYSASCTKLFVMELGYITIPLMSLTSFILMVLLLYFAKIKEKVYN